MIVDAGSDAGDAGDGGDGAVPHKRVFITSDGWNGNLKSAGNSTTTGLAGADKLCQTAAVNAGLGGSWIAWLSDSNTNAYDRIADVGPWYRLDGRMAFANKAGLKGNPMVTLNVNETGGTGTPLFPWTGTLANGTKAATNCSNWTVGALNGTTGGGGLNTSTTGTWTANNAQQSCFFQFNLYCFEQ